MLEITRTEKLEFEKAEIIKNKLYIYTSTSSHPIVTDASAELLAELKKNIETASEVTSVIEK